MIVLIDGDWTDEEVDRITKLVNEIDKHLRGQRWDIVVASFGVLLCDAAQYESPESKASITDMLRQTIDQINKEPTDEPTNRPLRKHLDS